MRVLSFDLQQRIIVSAVILHNFLVIKNECLDPVENLGARERKNKKRKKRLK